MNMKLSDRTIKILKNFSLFSERIVIPVGNKIYVRSMSCYAEATVEENFDKPIYISDLKSFLQHISILEEVNLRIEDTKFFLHDEKTMIEYKQSDPKTFDPKSDKPLDVADTTHGKFELASEKMNLIKKSKNIGMVKPDTVSFFTNDNRPFVKIHSVSNPSSTNVIRELEFIENVGEFNANIVPDNFVFLDEDYTVSITGVVNTGGKNVLVCLFECGDVKYVVPTMKKTSWVDEK